MRNPRSPYGRGPDPRLPFTPDDMRQVAYDLHGQADEMEGMEVPYGTSYGENGPSPDSQILRTRGDFFLVAAEVLGVLGGMLDQLREIDISVGSR